jgi:hypothetical protein
MTTSPIQMVPITPSQGVMVQHQDASSTSSTTSNSSVLFSSPPTPPATYQSPYFHQPQQFAQLNGNTSHESSATATNGLGNMMMERFSRPRVTTTLWEDEGTFCFQVEANGVCVARREDNDYVNGTKLLNVCGMTRGKRDGILKTEKQRYVVKVGAMHLKGVWIPFERALTFAMKNHIADLLYPLFMKDIKSYLYHQAYLNNGIPPNGDRSINSTTTSHNRTVPATTAFSGSAMSLSTVPVIIPEEEMMKQQRTYIYDSSSTSYLSSQASSAVTSPSQQPIQLPQYHFGAYQYPQQQQHQYPERPAPPAAAPLPSPQQAPVQSYSQPELQPAYTQVEQTYQQPASNYQQETNSPTRANRSTSLPDSHSMYPIVNSTSNTNDRFYDNTNLHHHDHHHHRHQVDDIERPPLKRVKSDHHQQEH